MNVSAAAVANIQSQPELSANMSGLKMNHVPPQIGEDEDASLSSSETSVFDRASAGSSIEPGRWRFDADGTWRRYGSSDSATSTGISSMCSSIAADDKSKKHDTQVTPSRKRTSDGTLKQSPMEIGPKAHTVTTPIQVTDTAPALDGQTTQKIPKRRGRPPKDKSLPASLTPKVRRASHISQLQERIRPRSAIPATLPKRIFASQCNEAAYASRLDPFVLHPGENELLADLLMNKEVTVYLNIRNTILRLWTQNPLCSVTPDEAAGCAKDGRFYGLAEIAYKWLVRNGYINFGCVEVPRDPSSLTNARRGSRQKLVVVIGAGVSGLTTARQLEHLFAQSFEKWTELGESPPRVIVLEGRKRIGGRVYSKPLRSQIVGSLPNSLPNTAEMGAMIVTGFEHGNPLDIVIRGQLSLHYHVMADELTIYDCDGSPVNEDRDMLNTELYTDISDRAGEFRAAPYQQKTLRGDEELITRARDPPADGYANFQLEPLFDPIDNNKNRKPAHKRGRRRNAPPGTEKLTGRSRVVEESGATQSAARAAKTMGWQLREGVARNQSVSLHSIAKSSMHPSLGTVMDEAIEQYQDIIDLTPQDMQLLNWHHANLEYANAAPVSSLSLSGHDQDTGNEFEGAHSEIIGGYSQVPRGLMNLPTKLDVRFDRIVDSIHFNEGSELDSGLTTKVVCTDGEVIEADEVVVTAPLGVLKAGTIDFDPPLPDWKQGAIERMGFGLLNKVVLLYDQTFWDDSRDMFGLLNEAEISDSLNPVYYAKRRGRFYLIWNASKISGRPVLVALMAGHAAHAAEKTDTYTLLCEINDRLHDVFKPKVVPAPLEVIVTRWKRDPFTRGTYSYVGPQTQPGDYDLLSKPVGNLHFAGEATCGTHPATVHGAFLSGLRVAAEVMDSMAGPITLPNPLVGPALTKQELPARQPAATPPLPAAVPPSPAAVLGGSWGSPAVNNDEVVPLAAPNPAVKHEQDTIIVAKLPLAKPAASPRTPSVLPRQSVCAGDASFWVQASYDAADLGYEAGVMATILSQIGERPAKPARPGVNPFLLYTKSKWEECKLCCARDSSGAGRDAIRQTLGKWWKALSEEEKQPYLVQSQKAQELADAVRKEWEQKVAQYDMDAKRIKEQYVRNHPPSPIGGDGDGRPVIAASEAVGVSKRKTNTSNCVVLDHV